MGLPFATFGLEAKNIAERPPHVYFKVLPGEHPFLHFKQDCIQLGKQRCIGRLLHNRLYRHLSPNLPCRDSNTLNADKLVAGDRLFNFQA